MNQMQTQPVLKKKNRKWLWPIGTIFLIIVAMTVSGCTVEDKSTATPSQNTASVTDQQKQTELLATATTASVDTMAKNWDADAEDDGIIVYPELKDANNETVQFENTEMNVDIELWTTKYDNFNEVKDRNLYSGTGKINSWKDGNFLYEGGIKIPFDEIKAVASDNQYGMVFVKIHTPAGKTFEAKASSAIKP
jgi:hypothetical protein